jgi:hypothetical protein
MTQAEINAQPAWLLATETKIGTAIVLVGLAIATGGTGDAAVEGKKVVKATVKATENVADVVSENTFDITLDFSENTFDITLIDDPNRDTQVENIFTDAFRQGAEPFDFANEGIGINVVGPQIVEVADIVNNEEIARADQKLKLKNMLSDYGIF